LLECKKLHLNKVLLGCYKENIGSAKTILNNGGILENEMREEGSGKIIQRYWISIPYDR
jgi:predicted acetyltransferase